MLEGKRRPEGQRVKNAIPSRYNNEGSEHVRVTPVYTLVHIQPLVHFQLFAQNTKGLPHSRVFGSLLGLELGMLAKCFLL